MVDSIPSGSSGTATEFDTGHHNAAFPDWVENNRPLHARRKSSERRSSITREPDSKSWWKFKLRPWDDDQERDWWFAGTAIPYVCANEHVLALNLRITGCLLPPLDHSRMFCQLLLLLHTGECAWSMGSRLKLALGMATIHRYLPSWMAIHIEIRDGMSLLLELKAER